MRFLRLAGLIAPTLYLIFSTTAGIVLIESSLRLPHNRLSDSYRAIAYQRAAKNHFTIQEVSIRTADGVILRGWYVEPVAANGSTAVLLHGVTDNRLGMAAYAQLLLENGYSVLLPDARNHGESGGEVASYGVREAKDVHEWVDWLYKTHSPNCLYGLGESMGAAILLQSLAYENRFCAVAAESAFAEFREGAYDRVGRYAHMPPWLARTVFRPAIEIGILYAHERYNLNLPSASPRQAVAASRTPVLLIHGTEDVNIWPRNSEMIHRASLDHSELWEVPRAVHCGAWSTEPRQFETRLLGWFARFHSGSSGTPSSGAGAPPLRS